MQTEPILTKTSASIQDILGADLGRITVERGDSAPRLCLTALHCRRQCNRFKNGADARRPRKHRRLVAAKLVELQSCYLVKRSSELLQTA
jgi:hypothetical protein